MTWHLLLGGAFALQLVYWHALRRGFRQAQDQVPPPADPAPDTAAPPAAPPPPVSVVVAARNEARQLPALLQALARQTHPDFEVILVDDASDDATADLARAWAATQPRARLVQVDEPRHPRKKHALTRGIRAATYDLLVLTDADCTPPPDWLAVLARMHAPQAPGGPDLLVGYSPFRRRPGLLNRLARYETFVTGFLTAAAVGLGRPYMAVGRNLSYTKSTFERIGGFAHSLQSLSGDDDLLVQEVVRRGAARVRHVFDPRTFVPTEAPHTWRQWLRQKRRHVSGSRFYARDVQVHLTVFQGTALLLWLAPFVTGWAGAALLGAKLLVQGRVLYEAAPALGERDLFPAQPFLELLYAGYHLLVVPLGLARLPKRW